MSIHDKDQFAEAFKNLDATKEPEEIRRLIDRDAHKELRQSEAGNWYSIENGELKPAGGEHGDEKTA